MRLRISAAATLVVAVALVIGAVILSLVQRDTLTDNIDDTLRVRANDLAALIRDDSLPRVLSIRDSEEALVQVIGPEGDLIAASINVGGEPLLTQGFVPNSPREIRTFEGLPIEDEPFRVIAQRLDTDGGGYLIYVAESLDPVEESIGALNRAMLVAVPLLVLLVGGLTWLVVGRALAPVEAIRAQVASIGGAELDRRVPEPAVEDEIGRLARTMNAMLERLQAAQERQQRFVADASHELRSPLTAIRAQVEVDLARPESAQPLETEQAVLDEALRLERLVEDLLLLARSDVGSPLQTEPLDLDDIVFREIEREREGTDIAIDSSGVSGAQLDGDRDQLGRAVRNLLENAVRYASERVVVTLAENGREIVLSVTDDGPGIPTQERDRVFERFTRLDEARARGDGGSGLGLAITREIVERHGGEIELGPDYTDGARFVVRLPARTA